MAKDGIIDVGLSGNRTSQVAGKDKDTVNECLNSRILCPKDVHANYPILLPATSVVATPTSESLKVE